MELQNNVEKLQKKLDEKQKVLKSLTRGKENLNAILGSKINVNKEGLGYVPKIKKKYDVITMNFVPQQKIEINPLIKMNCTISRNNDKNLFTIDSGKEKGKEKIEENQTIQVKFEMKLKALKINLKSAKKNSQKNKNMSIGRLSNLSVSTHVEKSQHNVTEVDTAEKTHIHRLTHN